MAPRREWFSKCSAPSVMMSRRYNWRQHNRATTPADLTVVWEATQVSGLSPVTTDARLWPGHEPRRLKTSNAHIRLTKSNAPCRIIPAFGGGLVNSAGGAGQMMRRHAARRQPAAKVHADWLGALPQYPCRKVQLLGQTEPSSKA